MKGVTLVASYFILLSVAVLGDTHPTYETGCVQLNGTISLNITYMLRDGNKESMSVKVPKDAQVTGTCGNSTASLVITDSKTKAALGLTFVKNNGSAKMESIDSKHWGVTNITYTYSPKEDAKNHTLSRSARKDAAEYVTPISGKLPKLYSCKKEKVVLENVKIVVGNTSHNATGESVAMNIEGLQIAYGANVSNINAYDYHYCKADQKVKDIVPIAVGCALAALVIIVLIAYLIGRRRTVAAGGYERV